MSETPRVDQVHWNHAYLKEEAYKLERELNAAQQRIKRLEEAGDAVEERLGCCLLYTSDAADD